MKISALLCVLISRVSTLPSGWPGGIRAHQQAERRSRGFREHGTERDDLLFNEGATAWSRGESRAAETPTPATRLRRHHWTPCAWKGHRRVRNHLKWQKIHPHPTSPERVPLQNGRRRSEIELYSTVGLRGLSRHFKLSLECDQSP